MKKNTGVSKRRVENKKFKITKGNDLNTSENSTKASYSSVSKENSLPKNSTATTTHTLISPLETKIVLQDNKSQKRFKLKELPKEFDNLNMSDSDELYSFFNKSTRVNDQKKDSSFITTREQFKRPSPKEPLEEKNQTTFRRPSPIRSLEEKKRDSQTVFRRPSPIRTSQPIEKDSTEYSTRNSTKFQRPSPIKSFGQDEPLEILSSDKFRVPSPIRNEPTESPTINREKRGIKPTTANINDDDEFLKLSGRSNIKLNAMDKARSVEKYSKNSTRARTKNSSSTTSTKSNETELSKVELKTRNVQLSLIDDFYEPSKKRDDTSRDQGINKSEPFKKSRRMEQKDNETQLSKYNANEKPSVTDKKTTKEMSYNEKKKNSRIINEQSPRNKKNGLHNLSPQQSDDDFMITSKSNPKNNSHARLSQSKDLDDRSSRTSKRNPEKKNGRPQPNSSDDDDFLSDSLHMPKKKRNSFRLPYQINSGDNDLISSHKRKCNTKKKRKKPNLSDDDFMDIPPNANDESEILNNNQNNQREEFRAPSPTRNKYADLPEMDLLSEEEIPVQSNSREKREGSAEYKHCPFCKEPIPFPLPERIRAYLIKINPNKLSDQTKMPSPSVLLQHSLNVIDQFEFCRLHDAETHIVPEGLKKNYPIKIDFDRLPKRVEELIPDLMLVIKGEIRSLYRDVALNAYQEFGRARARKPTILMGRFQKFQPGYYGSKGASIISSSLVSLLMDTNILTMNMTKPQEPLEYLNQVLVPETAVRLISQDRGGIPLEEARKAMEDSVEFGMYVHDIDDELDDELGNEF